MSQKKQENVSSNACGETRLFYGYIIVISAFIILMLTFGIHYSFGIFFKPLIAEFGWSRAVTSAAFSLMTIGSGLLGIFAGRLSDIFGPKALGVAGGIFLGLGFLLMSQVNNIWQVYLIHGLLLAAGVGGCWPILMPTVARWFTARRGLMSGVVAAGIGLGTVTTPQLAVWLISAYDWRAAYIIIGGITLVLIVLAALFLKRDPSQMGQSPYGENGARQESPTPTARGYNFKEAIRTKNFIILCTIYFCFGFCLTSIMVHIVPHATEIGIPTAIAAVIMAIIGGMNIVGKITMGIVSDKIGVKASLIICLAIITIVFLWLQLARELWSLYLFGIVFGFAYGAVVSFMAIVTAELFGLGSMGIIIGSIAFIYTIGGAIGPLLSGHIFDITGSYSLAFAILIVLSTVSCILAFSLKPSKTS